jgi:hypothetical protein
MDGRDSEAKGDISIENSQNPSERLFQKIYLIGYAFKWPPDTINPEDRQEKYLPHRYVYRTLELEAVYLEWEPLALKLLRNSERWCIESR